MTIPSDKNRFPGLLSPLTIRGKTFRNRIMYTPMGGLYLDGKRVLSYCLDNANYKSAGGGAQYAVGETNISHKGGRGDNGPGEYDFFDYSPENVAPFKAFTDMVHSHGLLVSTELVHTGDSKMVASETAPAMGPSEYLNCYGIPVVEMTQEMIDEAVEEYGKAAKFMQLAGYDSVIPHLGHGWLPQQFLTERTNHRTDGYGGSIENRSRLSVEILQSIRRHCGEDMIIESRISGMEFMDGSWSVDELCAFAKCIAPYTDIIHVSCGHYRDPMHTRMMSTLYDDHGCNVYLAERIKQVVGNSCKVAVVGGINSPELAEDIIASGKADFVVLGRQSITDPEFARKAAEGREDEIIRCTRCLRCFPGPAEEADLEGGLPDYCSIQPKWDRLELARAPKASEHKKLLVVGGGVAGLQAAVTATERGHTVTLIERSGVTGGWLNHTQYDADKRDVKVFADTLRTIATRAGVDIRLNTELTPQLMAEIDPDAVFAAIGSDPIVPDIPGIDGSHVVFAAKAYEPGVKMGTHAVVIGGGYIGCEAAIHLWKNGMKVVLVDDTHSAIASDGYRLHRQMVTDLMNANIEYHLSTSVAEIKDHSVVVTGKDGVREIPADLVVYAVGNKARDYSAIEEMAEGREFKAIGDCVEARTIADATGEAYEAAFDLGWGGYEDYMARFADMFAPPADEDEQ